MCVDYIKATKSKKELIKKYNELFHIKITRHNNIESIIFQFMAIKKNAQKFRKRKPKNWIKKHLNHVYRNRKLNIKYIRKTPKPIEKETGKNSINQKTKRFNS